MKLNILKHFFTLTLTCLVSLNLTGQTSVNTCGGDGTGNGGSVAFSVGQVFFQIIEDQQISLSEGVQQAFEISIIDGIEEEKPFSFAISAFPNPIMDVLHIELKDEFSGTVMFQVHDAIGNLIQEGEASSSKFTIQTTNWSGGAYYLHVYNIGSLQSSTLKIVKTS
ncbi:MAG: T9SS type A sorting domain-containing protein [Flavobacteriales bacterium]|nr:T9SS type A sorting domain-containing protein [Flavobacteriales bacterium]MDG1766749.1 T9SS type A sorting domain-containing protein [Flavobacteriales bacterium]